MTRIFVLASHNRKKAAEMRAILEPFGIDLAGLDEFPGAPEPEETGVTFEENAVIKAKSALEYTGLAALADDSGLVVDALGGEPGVYSARYAVADADDKANNVLLLERLQNVPAEKRTARFVSVVALALPEGTVRLFRGETEGRILHTPRGGGGFGYDPLFFSFDLQEAFGAAAPEDKNRVSHRGRALQQLRDALAGFGG